MAVRAETSVYFAVVTSASTTSPTSSSKLSSNVKLLSKGGGDCPVGVDHALYYWPSSVDPNPSRHTSVRLALELGKITFSTGKQKLTPGEVTTFQGF